MAELATIARPYAEAVFRVAQKSGKLTAWSKWLCAFAHAASYPALLKLAANPKVKLAQISELLVGVVPPLDKQAENFVHIVLEAKRLEVVPAIAKQFDALKSVHEGVADAFIESAFALDKEALDSLVSALKRRFGKDLVPHVKIEPALIGGVRVTVGDEVLDTSVRAQLAKMQTTLTSQ